MTERITKSVEFEVVHKSHRERKIFGWAYQSVTKDGEQIVDISGDVIDVAELESAGHEFVRLHRMANLDHEGGPIGELIEAVVTTKDKQRAMGIPPGHVPEGLWLGLLLKPEIFDLVSEGSRLAFSIEGKATPEAV